MWFKSLRQQQEIETAAFQNSSIAFLDPSTLGLTGIGSSPYDQFLLDQVKIQHPAVYSASRLIINTVSMLPYLSWQGGLQTNTRVVVEESILNPVQPAIVTQPNPFETKRQTMAKILSSLVFRGNAFLWLTAVDESSGRPTVAIPINPDEVFVTWNDARTRPVYTWRGQVMTIGEDFAHIHDLLLPGELLGTGPLDAGRRTINSGLEMDDYSRRFFIEDATPSGQLKVPGKLTLDQAALVREQWTGQHQGNRRLGITSGGVEFEPISITPDQAQFIQTRDYNTGEVSRLFNIPGEMLGWNTEGASLTYRNLQDLYTQFIRQCLQPSYIEPIEDVWTTYLLPRGQQLRFDFATLQRSEAKERFETYAVAVGSGIMTVNEVRKIENLPPVEGGDEVRTNERSDQADSGDDVGGEAGDNSEAFSLR